MKDGKLTPKLHKTTFDKIPEAIEDLKEGKVQGRLVAVYEDEE